MISMMSLLVKVSSRHIPKRRHEDMIALWRPAGSFIMSLSKALVALIISHKPTFRVVLLSNVLIGTVNLIELAS